SPDRRLRFPSTTEPAPIALSYISVTQRCGGTDAQSGAPGPQDLPSRGQARPKAAPRPAVPPAARRAGPGPDPRGHAPGTGARGRLPAAGDAGEPRPGVLGAG